MDWWELDERTSPLHRQICKSQRRCGTRNPGVQEAEQEIEVPGYVA